MRALLAQADVMNPLPLVLLMLAGFVVAIIGHIVRFKVLVVLGILLVFAATVLIPVGLYVGRS